MFNDKFIFPEQKNISILATRREARLVFLNIISILQVVLGNSGDENMIHTLARSEALSKM